MSQILPRAIFCATLVLVVGKPALAGGGGMCGGCSTEVTQLLNNAQLVEQYVLQGKQYVEQTLQTQAMLKNLMRNPLGVLAPDLARLANDVARLQSMGVDIASSVSRIDQDFASTFQNPTAQLFADKFKSWTASNVSGMRSVMMNAGVQRENFASDATALQALVGSADSADGNLAALHALSAINARQVQESMMLRDLISAQQIETAKFMTASAKKEQDIADINNRLWQFENKPLPTPREKRPGQF